MILDLDFIKPFKETTRAHNLRFLSSSYGWDGTSTPNIQRVLTIEEGAPIRIIERLQRFNGCSRAYKSPTIYCSYNRVFYIKEAVRNACNKKYLARRGLVIIMTSETPSIISQHTICIN